MGLESILLWIVVGLVAGVLASLVVGGGFGIIGDILAGIAGAFLGGWLFSAFDINSPVGGILGTILVAFVGAVIILGLLRLATRGRAARV